MILSRIQLSVIFDVVQLFFIPYTQAVKMLSAECLKNRFSLSHACPTLMPRGHSMPPIVGRTHDISFLPWSLPFLLHYVLFQPMELLKEQFRIYNFFFFNWRIIALQCCIDFCHTSTWIRHRCTYVPSFLNLWPTSQPFPPLDVVTEPWFEFPESYSKFPLALYFTYGNVSFHVTLFIHLILSLLPSPVSIGLFFISPLLPWK